MRDTVTSWQYFIKFHAGLIRAVISYRAALKGSDKCGGYERRLTGTDNVIRMRIYKAIERSNEVGMRPISNKRMPLSKQRERRRAV
jgi:hypothetical protein